MSESGWGSTSIAPRNLVRFVGNFDDCFQCAARNGPGPATFIATVEYIVNRTWRKELVNCVYFGNSLSALTVKLGKGFPDILWAGSIPELGQCWHWASIGSGFRLSLPHLYRIKSKCRSNAPGKLTGSICSQQPQVTQCPISGLIGHKLICAQTQSDEPTRWINTDIERFSLNGDLTKSGWYPRPDSNRHTSRREILNLLRLPFRHSGTRSHLTRIAEVGKSNLA